LKNLIKKIQESKTIILSTHRQCDGDGLGAELALFHALRKTGKDVKMINVDVPPRKYAFLEHAQYIQIYEDNLELPSHVDLFLVFDTNDERMVNPLLSAIKSKTDIVAFIDHHPVLKNGPKPTALSWIDVKAASTGEMTYALIKGLEIPFDYDIARAIYTSITFDTQLYRYIRNSPTSHLIAAEMLGFDIKPDEVHRGLFGNQTVSKMAFLAKALGQIEYHCQGSLAILKIKDSDMFHYNLEPDDSRDVVDVVMNIETVEAAALFREDTKNEYKLSLRSKGLIEVLELAETMGGGGHVYSSGAFLKGEYSQLKEQVVTALEKKLKAAKTNSRHE
jgi:phosphoesterase RecJ-like protein